MPSVYVTLPNGGIAIVKVAKKRGAKCDECNDRVSEYLCDFPTGMNITCDRKLCNQCRTLIAGNDYCTLHTGCFREAAS